MTIANSSSNRTAILFGSPNTQGNTKRLLDCFLSFCPEDAEASLICCYDLNILPCIGCDRCKEEGRCVRADLDDFGTVSRVIESSERFIIATPVYFLGFPGPVKNLFDRFQTYYYNQPFKNEEPRKAVLLITEGSDDESGPLQLQTSLSCVLRTIHTELVDTVVMKGTDRGGEADRGSCKAAAEKLYL